jgi:hypothetical protein
MFPQVACQPGLPLVLEAATFFGTEVEAVLGVVTVPILVNKDSLANLTFDGNKINLMFNVI